MVGNSLMGQFQNFEPELFTNSRSSHGFEFVEQKYRCMASNFQLSPYCSFVGEKYDGSNMAGMTAANIFKAVDSCWTFCQKQNLILSEVFRYTAGARI